MNVISGDNIRKNFRRGDFVPRFEMWGSKHVAWTAFLLFLLAFSCFFIFSALQGFPLSRDAESYILLCRDALQAGKVSFGIEKFPPLHLILLFFSERFCGIPCKVTGILLSMLSSATAVSIIFLGVFEISKRYAWALLSGILWFLIPTIRNVSCDVLRDAPSLCLNLAAVFSFILFWRTETRKHLAAAGFFLILACGFRYENIEFVFLLTGMDLYRIFRQKNISGHFVATFLADTLIFATGMIAAFLVIYTLSVPTDFFSRDHLDFLVQNYYLKIWRF